MIKIGDEIEVIEKVNRGFFRWMWTGIVQEIITDPDRAKYTLGEPPIYMVKFKDYAKNPIEPFMENEIELHNPLSKSEIEGKWLWGHQSKIFVEKKAKEENFYIIHEPGSPWGPRPNHFDGIKYNKIVDESFKPDSVEGSSGINSCGFCSCQTYKAGKNYAEIVMEVNVNKWDLEKAIKPIQDLLRLKNIRVEASVFRGKTTLKFLDMDSGHNHEKENKT